MNLYMKQNRGQREQTGGCQSAGDAREGWSEVWDQQMQTIIQRMAKQQGPTVQHRETYSISCDKPQWKRMKNTYR